jgi:hypothetical protein
MIKTKTKTSKNTFLNNFIEIKEKLNNETIKELFRIKFNELIIRDGITAEEKNEMFDKILLIKDVEICGMTRTTLDCLGSQSCIACIENETIFPDIIDKTFIRIQPTQTQYDKLFDL